MPDKHPLCHYVRPAPADQHLLECLGLPLPLLEVGGMEEYLGETWLKDNSFASVYVRTTDTTRLK